VRASTCALLECTIQLARLCVHVPAHAQELADSLFGVGVFWSMIESHLATLHAEAGHASSLGPISPSSSTPRSLAFSESSVDVKSSRTI